MKTLLPFCAAVLFASCSTQVQHGLDERDANEIVAVLSGRGYEVKKVPEKGKKPTWAIEVDEASATEVVRVLTELKLPRAQRLKTQTIASSGALIETPQAERLRQLEAQEGDLEESLELLDGVSSAAVELVVPMPARPGQPPTPSKASVLLRATPEAVERLTRQRGELRALVAGAVDGLQADDVVLVVDAVTLLPEPKVAATSGDLRPVVVGLAVTLTVLATLLVFVTWRVKVLREQRSNGAASPTPTPTPSSSATPRPVVNAVQRRAAAS